MLSSLDDGVPYKPLSIIIQEQQDEKMAKDYQLQMAREEDAYWEQIELATKLSIQEKSKHDEVKVNSDVPPESKQTQCDSEENSESDGEGNDEFDDYYIARQTQNLSGNITVTSSKLGKKPKTQILSQDTDQNGEGPGPESVSVPVPGYEVSTSCGRVYKNRIPRPITTGACKTRENGPLEIEPNTGVPGLILVYNFLSQEEEKNLLDVIEKLPWATNRAQTRRVQLYVPWKEDPKFVIVPKSAITPLPPLAKEIAQKNHNTRYCQFSSLGMGPL